MNYTPSKNLRDDVQLYFEKDSGGCSISCQNFFVENFKPRGSLQGNISLESILFYIRSPLIN